MKKSVLLILMFISISTSQKVFSQTTSVKTVYTEQKCDELVHRLADSLMKISGDVSKNFMKINEMTNRVTYQFVTDFGKELGKPVSGDDFTFLWEKSKQCINGPTKFDATHKLCSLCHGSSYIACTVCKGVSDPLCKDCKGNGYVILNNVKSRCIMCQGMGFINCWACKGVGRATCTKCQGSGYEK
ncbi:MAG: hypothetical protein NTZ19_01320 [Bacteroidetes bacterium]|nr:hypothetical protein [Bacteroidota bacterium]